MKKKLWMLLLILFLAFSSVSVDAGELFTYPRFVAIDGNGRPIRGGLLYTYEAGTSTLKSAYSDKACSVAHTNPIVLDSNGTALVYLKGSYKLNLKTPAGAQVPGWPVDNIEGISQSTLNYYYPDSGAADQGVTGSSNTIKYYIDTIAANNGTIYLTHAKGSSTTVYTFATSETVPANVKLILDKGVRISVSAGQTLTFSGTASIEAGDFQIFQGDGSYTFAAGTNVRSTWFADVTTAVSKISTAAVNLLVVGGSNVLTGSTTIPATLATTVSPGSYFTKAGAYTLTINGPFNAYPMMAFSGFSAGNVTFAAVDEAYAEWWYSGSGSYDTPFQCAVQAFSSGPGKVKMLNKTYALVSGFTVNAHRIFIDGAGPNASIFSFTPTGTASAITFDLTGTAAIVGGGIKNVGFMGYGTQIKTAIEMVNQEGLVIENVSIGSGTTWTDPTYASIGVHSRGKHMLTISKCDIMADTPIRISQNTNRATEGNIDCDHYRIRDNTLTADNRGASSTNANILIDSGVNLYNFTVDGGAWSLGGYGLKWVDTATTSVSTAMSIKNVRWEQSTYTAGYMIDIEHNYALQTFIGENLYGGYQTKGMKFNKVSYINLNTYEYVGSTTALETDATSRPVILQNCFITAGTLTMTGLTKVFDSGLSTTLGVIGALVIYDTPSLTKSIPSLVGLNDYANNAAAVSAGLTAGQLYYVTGTGALMVVY